jgi:hypothetical protein
MNDQEFDSLPSIDLPKPQTEQAPDVQEIAPPSLQGEAPAAIALEQGASPAAASPPVQIPPQAITMPLPDPGAQQMVAPVATPSHLPQIADDGDLIEKEWVVKAKEIVEKTKHDPYLQNQEINKVKADYLKKRYNKELKVSSE